MQLFDGFSFEKINIKHIFFRRLTFRRMKAQILLFWMSSEIILKC